MPDIEQWLNGRHPPGPAHLQERILKAVAPGRAPSGHERGQSAGAPPVEPLLDSARRHLELALGAPGRVRASAYELLLADALITFACEAALAADRPDEALSSLLVVGAAR